MNRIVVVINAECDLGVSVNGAGHALYGLRSIASDQFTVFSDSNDKHIASLTDFPLICLKAGNSAELHQFYEKLCVNGVDCNVFVEQMRHGTPNEQKELLKSLDLTELPIIAVAAVGENSVMRELTSGLPLLR